MLESLFLYLDRVYISQQQAQNVQTVQQTQIQSNYIHIKRFGINFFKSYSLKNSDVLIENLMKLIEKIRNENHNNNSND